MILMIHDGTCTMILMFDDYFKNFTIYKKELWNVMHVDRVKKDNGNDVGYQC